MTEITTIEGYNVAINNVTFDGGTTNAIGDEGGTNDPYTMFTVTGVVAVRFFGFCTTLLASAGGGTTAVGTALNTTGLITTTTATDIDASEIWHDASPDSSVELWTVATEKIVTQNIIMTNVTADITSGVIKFICLWRPLSPGASVVSTGT